MEIRIEKSLKKKLKLELSYNPAVTSLNIYPKESN